MKSGTTLPPFLATGGFAVRDGLASGVSASRLRGRDLDAPYWGVRTTAGIASDEAGKATAFFSRAADLIVVSHVSAAKLWGMPLPARFEFDERLHVSVPPDVRAPKGRGIAGHHVTLHPMDVVPLSEVRVTSQARTLCDLSGLLPEEDLLAITDYLLWWRRDDADRLSRVEISTTIDRHPTKRGMARLRAVAPIANDRADSAPESIIRYRILAAGLPVPAVNPELFDARGSFLAMPDLAYPKFRIALDYEGDHHRTESVQWEKDIHRVPRLQDAGWHHTRISKSDLRDSGDFLTRLARNLRERGWTP
jgi:hypothetical protein